MFESSREGGGGEVATATRTYYSSASVSFADLFVDSFSIFSFSLSFDAHV